VTRRSGMTAAGLVTAAVVAAVVVVHERGSSPVDVTPVHPEPIRLKDGSFRGVHLGERTKDVVRMLGRPVRWGGIPDPTGASEDEGVPSGPGDAISLDYRDLAIAMRVGRAVWIVTTSPDAQLRRGVNVGDSLAIAERRLPRLRCSPHDSSNDEGGYGPPICQYRVHPGVNLEIIGDPITTIAVHGTRPRSAAQGRARTPT
jgi:hypothetical protein